MNFILGLIAALLVRYLILTWNSKNKPTSDGYEVLKLPAFYGYIGVIGLAAFIGVCISAVEQFAAKGMPTIGLIIVAGTVMLSVLWLGILLMLWTWVFEIKINEQEIIQRSRTGKESSLKWTDVKQVSFDSLSLQVTLTDGVKKIKCHQHSDGFEKLVAQIKTKLNLDRQELGIPEY
ncbi:hypothetical protein [Cesiribacter sp. SM1]|uniref:hypothetical protein n=1 Tax=Cesiribacter sp. SM1 TaxID=2861196 RepID=UPI001CD770C6|nr:hypothetical protein [Cesiribacter sp. SM1]